MFQTRSVLRWSWQRHAPKSRLLSFKGTLKTGTWDEKSREIPCPSKLKEPENSNFNSSKHATLNCNYLLWLPVKNCFQNECDIGWGPRPVSFLTSTEAFAASSSLALSTLPLNAAECSGVEPQQHRRRRRHHLLRLPAASELPGRCCPGRPRPRPSPGERRRPPRGRGMLPGAARPGPSPWTRRVGRGSAGRGAGGPAPPPGRRAAPPRRCCRLGAGRNAAEMKFLSSLDLYVLSSLSPSLLLLEIILNKLETELIELLSSWCSCYGTWSATSNYFQIF